MDWQAREVGVKKVLLTTIIAVTIAAGPSHAQQTTTDQLIGSWKALNLKATAGDKVTYPRGAGGWLRYHYP
jgi:hypothetical protein